MLVLQVRFACPSLRNHLLSTYKRFAGGNFNVVSSIKFNGFSVFTILCPFCIDQFGVIAIFGNIFCRVPFAFIKEPDINNGIFIKFC